MSQRRFKLVGFDMDDTLYPEREYELGGFKAVSEFARAQLGIPELYELLVQVSTEIEARGRTFDTALGRLGFPYDAVLIQRMVSIYHQGHGTLVLSLYPDVGPVLQQLRKNYSLILITDGPVKGQCNKIKALGISPIFHKIYCTDRYGQEFRKPSPFTFQQAMRDFSAPASSCVYVGNDSRKDFLAPNQLGWLTAKVQRTPDLLQAPTPEHQAQVTIEHLGQLKQLLERGSQ